MKPGWKTSECWQAALAQVLALFTLLGVISSGDSKSLEDALGKCVMATFALVTNGVVVLHYIKSRFNLKALAKDNAVGVMDTTVSPPNSFHLLLIGTIGVAVFFGQSSQLQAQLLPWRQNIMQKLQQHEDKINNLKNAPQNPPLQSFPIAAAPQQSFPIQGLPQQSFPIQGQPQQSFPIQGQPQQALPIQGQPQQQFPIAGPAQPLPIAPPPVLQQGPQTYSRQLALAKPID